MDVLPFIAEGVRVIGWALVHFSWECGIAGLLYWFARGLMPRGDARYRLGMTLLILLAICPVVTIWQLLRAAPSVMLEPIEVTAAPATGNHGIAGSFNVPASANAIDFLMPWLVFAWLFGVLGLSFRARRQWTGLTALVCAADAMPLWQRRVSDMAIRFGLQRHVRVLSSYAIDAPVLIGWLKPVILLPVGVVCNFPVAQIELIFAHELAHLRRLDPLANLFQISLETLHFYHPVLHWISRDVRNEREICCDRLALSITGGSHYQLAEALAELGEMRERYSPVMLAANGGILLDRVQQIVAPDRGGERTRKSAHFVAILFAAALVGTTVRLEWVQAQNQRNLTSSSLQLNAIFELRGLSFERFAKPLQLPDLVPSHGTVFRPIKPITLATANTSSTSTPPIAGRITAPITRPRLAPLRVADLSRTDRELPVSLPTPRPVAAQPIPVYVRRPIYPQDAVMTGVQGKVTVEFGIAADGSVQDLRVVQAIPVGVFDLAAEQAMRGWRFAPNANMSSHQTRYRQIFAFSLNTSRAMGAAPVTSPGAEIPAKLTCQIPTGTHICRWPESNQPKTLSKTD